MKYSVAYGKDGKMEFELEESIPVEVVEPNKVAIGDEHTILQKAVSNPINSKTFTEFVQDAKDILFIVNDATRPTPTPRVLDFLLPQVDLKKVKFIIATGIHRAPTEEEYRSQIFGHHYDKVKDRVYAHDSRKDEDMVYLGDSKNGTPMYVNRLGVEAHKMVIIGSVEPHYFGGYTGGRKAFLPGIASYKTIEKNHKFALDLKAQALALEGNPVHEDMEDAIKVIKDKEIFAIMTVLDAQHRLYAATAGEITDSFLAAINKAEDVYSVKIKNKADIVISVAPYPMDIDLYQSQKAMDNGKLALKEGGILILVAKCRDGLGDEAFFNLLASCKTPQETLEKIDREYKLGYHKAAKMAEISLWAETWSVTDIDNEVMCQAFFKPYHDLDRALKDALELKGSKASVLILNKGSLTVPIIST